MKLITSFLVLAMLTFAGFAQAAPVTLILKNQFGEQSTNTVIGGNGPAASQAGIYVLKVSAGFAAINAAGSGVPLALGVAIPINAIVKQTYYRVTTTFVDSGTAGNVGTTAMSIGLNTNVDVLANVTIVSGTPWAAGIKAGIQLNTAATFTLLTAARQIKVTRTAGSGDATALTAGAMDIYVEYVLPN
jgi:hypothetical protein